MNDFNLPFIVDVGDFHVSCAFGNDDSLGRRKTK